MFFYRLMVRLFCYLTDRLPSLEQQTLMRLLSVAVSQSVAPADLLRAFAKDFGFGRNRAMMRAADLMEQGAPLAEALEQSPGLLREQDLLAVRCGTEMGTLRESLIAATKEINAPAEDAVQRVIDSFVYILALVFIASLIISFMLIKIVPTLRMIFIDFDLDLPGPLALFIATVEALAPFSVFFVLAFLTFVAYLLSGRLSRDLRHGWICRLLTPAAADGTLTVLDQLAIAKEAGRPLEPAISTLARYHHHGRMRRKLLYVRNELELGEPIWQAFVSAKVISKAESRAMETADTVGNTAWVLSQLAAQRRSRQAARIQVFSQVLFPMLILTVALVVGFIALSMLGAILTLPANLA